MQVVDVDMNRDESCPGTWFTISIPKALCLGHTVGCASAHFDVKESVMSTFVDKLRDIKKVQMMHSTVINNQLMTFMLMVSRSR